MNRSVWAACLGWMFSAVDIILLILFQNDVAAALHTSVDVIKIATGVGLLGSALGGVVFAQLGDRYGRVRTLGWSVIVYSLATAGMGLSPNVPVLFAMRFLSGIGTGGEWSVGFALVAEVSQPRRRGLQGGRVACFFNVGTFVAIVLFQLLGWRAAFLAMALPALGVLWLRRRVPESPVWVAFDDARRRGDVDPALAARFRRPPVALLFRGRMLGLTLKTTLVFTLMNFAFYLFSTTFIDYLQSSGGLALSKHAQAPYQLTLNVVSLVSVLSAGAISDRISRRLVYAALCVVGVAGHLVFYLRTHDRAAPTGLLLVLAVVMIAYGVNGIIGTITAELFPTHLRSTGPGVCQNLGKGIGGLAGPGVGAVLVTRHGFPFVLALPGLFLAALALLIWTLPRVDAREVAPVEDDGYLAAAGG
ncbi:MAG TPA: MFS transporter [Kofleriaceae bacterium]|nr:MFS transporter [Kofleriaceae bacterium]